MEVKIGQLYRHFKGNLYKALHIAINTETEEKMVIYQAMYDEELIFARPYDSFVSRVDRYKYPDVTQEYRFEPVVEGESTSRVESTSEEESGLDPRVLEFLDADSFSDKLMLLREMKNVVTDKMLNTMAYSVDLSLNGDTTEERYADLLNCISLRERYEGSRLRQ